MNKQLEVILILEDIRSVYNAGSIFRTADGFGVKQIYLCGFTPEPIDRFGRLRGDFHKTALGTEKTVLWKKGEVSKFIPKLRKKNFKIFAVEQDVNSKILQKLKIQKTGKVALVFGSETAGVKKETLKLCDEIFEINMRGKKESFNVSVTVGIVLYQILNN